MTKKPANDNKALKARSLSDLGALLAYRSRPEHFEPVQSNWTTDPNDAKVESEVRAELHTERYLRISPSLDKIKQEMGKPLVKNEDGATVAIGWLKFSNGAQYELADVMGPDGSVIQEYIRMPKGAMLGCDERLEASAGGGASPVAVLVSNAEISDRFGVENVAFTPKGRTQPGKSYTAKQSRALLDEAIANTPKMPSVTKCPPGLPTGTRQISDCFIGMKIGSSGKGGGMSWQDAYSKLRDKEIWQEVERELSAKDKKVLDVSMRAKNLAELGEYGHRRTREKQGMAKLQAANENLARAMRKKLA